MTRRVAKSRKPLIYQRIWQLKTVR